MKVIYFSPHLDDAIFSCGGIIAQQVKNGHTIEVWSFFTADPPAENLTPFAKLLHRRWGKQGNPYQERRDEDQAACRLLGVKSVHLGFEDCIYRHYPSNNSPVIRKTSDLFKPTREPEKELEAATWQVIKNNITPDDHVMLPLGAGGHVDHVLVKRMGCKLENQKSFYADFPYSGKLESIDELNLPGGHLEQNTSYRLKRSGCGSRLPGNTIVRSTLSGNRRKFCFLKLRATRHHQLAALSGYYRIADR